MTPKSGKAKGRRLQNWTAATIGFWLSKRVGKDEEIASREMGQSGPDVRLVGDALERFPFAVECKACESWAVHQWIEQARQNVDARVHRGWLIVAKRNHKAPVVMLDAELFFELWGERDATHTGTTDRKISTEKPDETATDRFTITEKTGENILGKGLASGRKLRAPGAG